jgi:predicted SAM-dependent methyltransferase
MGMPQTAATSQSTARRVHQLRAETLADVDVELPLSARRAKELGLAGLHCGSGANLKTGCLNTDQAVYEDASGDPSRRREIVRVNTNYLYLQHDATKPFPIDDGCFEWVYAEHLIEHIPLAHGIEFLREMQRVLKTGGFIRLSTPDLGRYAAGYVDRSGRFFDEHAARLAAMGISNVPKRRAWVVNQIFYQWGHRWIYDFDELRYAAVTAGFDGKLIERCGFRGGRDAAVAAFDLPIRNDESIYVEITKN